MRKVINKKLYDTDHARKVAYWDNDCPVNDFSYCEETLYQKPRTGEYFLVGSGGPRSPYNKVSYGSLVGSDALLILSRDEAMRWCEEKAPAEVYEAEFGIEDEGTRELSVLISQAAYEALNREAKKRGCDIATVIERLAAGL